MTSRWRWAGTDGRGIARTRAAPKCSAPARSTAAVWTRAPLALAAPATC